MNTPRAQPPFMASNCERIAEIQELLRSGAKEVTTDGTTVKFDPDSLRRELAQLLADDINHRTRKPRASRIRLGGF